MGDCASKTDESKRDDAVKDELDTDKKASEKLYKLLLLGPGNSGKSTFFKQIKQIHGCFSSDDGGDPSARAQVIRCGIVRQMRNLLTMAQEDFDIDLTDGKLADNCKYLNNLPLDSDLDKETAEKIKLIWSDESIKDVFRNRTHLGVVDSCCHFWDDIDRFVEPDYKPTFDDILLSRSPTSGICECTFTSEGEVFHLYDVGGQRNERTKWIHCFDQVHAVLFVASASCYDQFIYEDSEQKAMDEGLELFEEVATSEYFKNRRTSLVLFLNKLDLFEQKIVTKPFTIGFPDYEGDPHNSAECLLYLQETFLELNPIPETQRQFYAHVTCATDQQNVEKAFGDIQHAVVYNAMAHNGII